MAGAWLAKKSYSVLLWANVAIDSLKEISKWIAICLNGISFSAIYRCLSWRGMHQSAVFNSQNCNDNHFLTIRFWCSSATTSELPTNTILLLLPSTILYIINIFLCCCEQDLAFYISTALRWGWMLGEGGCPTGLVMVSETCKDNVEQLWPWRVQLISNSWQQLVTSSRPNSCHDIVLFYVSPTGSGALPKLYKGWGRLSLRVDRLSFSFKTWWWITGHLVTHLPVCWIPTC